MFTTVLFIIYYEQNIKKMIYENLRMYCKCYVINVIINITANFIILQ